MIWNKPKTLVKRQWSHYDFGHKEGLAAVIISLADGVVFEFGYQHGPRTVKQYLALSMPCARQFIRLVVHTCIVFRECFCGKAMS